MMNSDFFCPPGRPGPRDYLFFTDAAQRAATHVSSPNDIQLNIFTDGSPASKVKPGGVGICFGSWMPDQVDGTMETLGFVVPGVKCSNETEIVALADAILVVSAEIKRNIEALTSNKWSVKVNVRSDSLNALRLLENPERRARLATNRAMRLRDLIQFTLSEFRKLPIDVTLAFWWIPATSVLQHRFADKKSKCVAVKTGKAPLSHAMKAIFSKPNDRPHHPGLSDSKISAQNINKEKEELEEGEILDSRNEDHSGKKPVKGSVDHVRRRGRMGARARRRQAARNGNPTSANHSSDAVVTPDEIASSPKAAESSKPARDSVEDLQRLIPLDSFMPATIDRYARRAKYPDFYTQLWDAIEFLPRQQRSLMAMALEDQISVNIYPGWNASHGTMLSGIMANYRALYYPNIFSIVQRTALKLPEPMRDFMNDAIEKQHRRNCIRLG